MTSFLSAQEMFYGKRPTKAKLASALAVS